jgi:hypothetical protein
MGLNPIRDVAPVAVVPSSVRGLVLTGRGAVNGDNHDVLDMRAPTRLRNDGRRKGSCRNPPVVLPRWLTANSARGEGQTTGVVGTKEITDTELPRVLVT